MKIIRAVGIDLGTTNSAVSAMTLQGNDIALLEDRFKRKTIPSMVGWDPQSESFVTGWEAWNRRTLEPAPIASIKRKMGTQRTVDVGSNAMLPEEVSAQILKRLTGEMNGFLERQNQERHRRLGSSDGPPLLSRSRSRSLRRLWQPWHHLKGRPHGDGGANAMAEGGAQTAVAGLAVVLQT